MLDLRLVLGIDSYFVTEDYKQDFDLSFEDRSDYCFDFILLPIHYDFSNIYVIMHHFIHFDFVMAVIFYFFYFIKFHY